MGNRIAGYLRTLRKIPRILAHLRTNLSYALNDEAYWDEYARCWRPAEGQASLGDEWHNQERFLEILEKYSDRNAVALEIGCGGGRITAQAATWFREVHACDVSHEMLRYCAKSVQAPDVHFHKLDGFTLAEFQDHGIDCVYSHDVFVHFSSLQVYPYLREIKRVLKPGGLGIISFVNFGHDFEEFKETGVFYWERRRIPPHMRVHFITVEMVERMLRDLKLEVVEIDCTNYLIAVFTTP